jgi:uncharacterized membrane protein
VASSGIVISSSDAVRSSVATRLPSLDALRGLIMIVMAIDHVSYFVDKLHWGEFWGRPLPDYGTTAVFLTRFITHFCAPAFFFLMGAGMMLYADSRARLGWSNGKIARHFLLRGALLLLLQQLLENPAWLIADMVNPVQMEGSPGGGSEVFIHMGVLYSLGAAMIIWGLLWRLNLALTLLLSVGAVLMTQFIILGLDEVNALYSPVLRLFFIPGHTNALQVYYPVFPWVGLAGAGMAFGKALLRNQERAFKGALGLGVGFLAAFAVLRIGFGWGDFHAPQGSSWIDWLNLTKYPPSLAFVLLTLGVILLLVYLFSRLDWPEKRWGKPLLVFGRTPLFFYIAHLYLFAIIGFAFPNGTSLGVAYLIWFVGLLVLYPLCQWYGRFKQQTAPNSFWRLF